jgi:hypothetical protein
VSRQIQPHDVVEATLWMKLRARNRQGGGARMVTEGFDFTRRREIQGNVGRAIP